MNVTDLLDPAGAGSAERWARSSGMDQLISRKNRDMRHFDEDDWTILGWQDRRVLDGMGTHDKLVNNKDTSHADTIIRLAYVGMLIVVMVAYLS
jgi:hypothetical protein